jgi:general secretion pathway protein C
MLATDRRIPLFLALATSAAMIGLTAWQGYRFWDREFTVSGTNLQDTATTAPVAGAGSVPVVDFDSLALFGTATESGQAADINTENLPETNLRLTLRGVLAAEGEFPGSALVEDESRNTEAYLVGDTLPGNARLRTVLANRVIIERAGKLENLYFPENEDRTGFDVGLAQEPEPAAEPLATNGTPPAADSTADQERREEIRQRLEQLRQRLQNGN